MVTPNNTEIATATLPETGNIIVGRNGRKLGTRYFMGTACAKDLKAAGKDLGLRGRELKAYVDTALTDEKAGRAAAVAMTVSALASKGFVADTVDVKRNSAVIRFSKPAEVVAAPTVDVDAVAADARLIMARKLVAGGKFATVEEALAFVA